MPVRQKTNYDDGDDDDNDDDDDECQLQIKPINISQYNQYHQHKIKNEIPNYNDKIIKFG
jgi:hypothetical protein